MIDIDYWKWKVSWHFCFRFLRHSSTLLFIFSCLGGSRAHQPVETVMRFSRSRGDIIIALDSTRVRYWEKPSRETFFLLFFATCPLTTFLLSFNWQQLFVKIYPRSNSPHQDQKSPLRIFFNILKNFTSSRPWADQRINVNNPRTVIFVKGLETHECRAYSLRRESLKSCNSRESPAYVIFTRYYSLSNCFWITHSV